MAKARDEGYDIVVYKDPGGRAWESYGKTDKYASTNLYHSATGGSGREDYFVLNRDAIEILGEAERLGLSSPPVLPWQGPGRDPAYKVFGEVVHA